MTVVTFIYKFLLLKQLQADYEFQCLKPISSDLSHKGYSLINGTKKIFIELWLTNRFTTRLTQFWKRKVFEKFLKNWMCLPYMCLKIRIFRFLQLNLVPLDFLKIIKNIDHLAHVRYKINVFANLTTFLKKSHYITLIVCIQRTN